jgi:hypothetical protein
VQGADPLRPQPDLARGLLTGDDEGGTVAGRDPVGSTAPGTSPPPSTRSNSSIPVGTARAPASSTWAIGRAGAVTGPAFTDRSGVVGAPCSCSVPQAWHSGHRPTHFAEAKPHSVQRWDGRVDFTPGAGTRRR